MNLILEIIDSPKTDIFQKKVNFDKRGGKIGRSKSAKWTLNDPDRHISNYHAEITYKNNHYYITDISTNGMHFKNPQKKLSKGIPTQLTERTIFVIGDYVIKAKIIEEDFSSQKPLQINNKPDSPVVADDFFTENENGNAFDIISSTPLENRDIVSLLDSSFAPTITDNTTSSLEIDNLLDIGGENIGQAEDNLLYSQIETPTLDQNKDIPKKSALNQKTEVEGDGLFALLAIKLGIDIDTMSKKEKEKLVTAIGDLIVSIMESVIETSKITTEISKDMKETTINNTVSSSNAIKHAKTPYDALNILRITPHSLIYDIKSVFREIDTHIIAQYKTGKEIASSNRERFSPKSLYRLFEDSKLLEKSFTNKKALAWEAYVNKFKYLDYQEGEVSEFEKIQKVYVKNLHSLNLGIKEYN